MAMKTAMSASAMDFKEFLIAMSARILAIGYTPTNHDSDFLGAARACYKGEYVLLPCARRQTPQAGPALSLGRGTAAPNAFDRRGCLWRRRR
jgi:hypothetical protein